MKTLDRQVILLGAGEVHSPFWTLDNLIVQLNELARSSVYAPSRESLRQFVADVLDSEISSSEKKIIALLSDADNVIHGFAQIRSFAETADLDFIVIVDRARGRGYAAKMLGHVIDDLREKSVKKLLLEVGRDNLPALKLYTKLGFTQIAVRKAYYRTGEDALILEKCI
jgi:ribosomal-protein-alanine N-acetyltransferase